MRDLSFFTKSHFKSKPTAMLIEFSVGNYRSFKEQVTFSLVAANLVAKDKALDQNNTYVVDEDLTLLKSAAIYGANASGKSNLAKALGFMKQFMINSSRETQSTDGIPVEAFRLSTETENLPSYFQIVFLMDGTKYRYGFEVDRTRVVSEWLYYVPKARETNLFTREFNSIKAAKTYDAEGVQQRTRDNALFLSVSAQFNVEMARLILDWLTNQLELISSLHDQTSAKTTIKFLRDERYRDYILKLINKLDLGITQIAEIQQENLMINAGNDEKISPAIKAALDKLTEAVKGFKPTPITTEHRKFDGNGNYHSNEQFDLNKNESDGSQKIFALAGPIANTLLNGRVLWIDEFDSSLHPLISRCIVELFNSNEANPKNSQLIITTHDTNLLSNKIFRRDQVWFTEKDRYGASDLYSLAEYNVRNDASFESDYIKGKYGAIPYIGDLNSLVSSHG
jgi:uncharacterized protein